MHKGVSRWQRLGLGLVAAAMLSAGSWVTPAPTRAANEPRGVEAVTLYQGSDRLQRLVEAARREGALNIYSSMNIDQLSRVVDGFKQWLERTHGLKPHVTVWRGQGEALLQKVLLEARSGRQQADIVETDSIVLESLKRERLLARLWSPYLSHYPEAARDSDGRWIGTRLNIFTQAYNTNLVRASELPRSWADLLNPRWRGQLAIEADDWDWFATLVKQGPFGDREQALEFFRKLRQQDLQVRSGHSLLAQLQAAGEVPLVLTQYNYIAQSFKDRGAPVDWFVIEPAVARANGLGVPAQAPHPNLAILFADYVMSPQGQTLHDQLNLAPASREVPSRLTRGFRFVYVDVNTVVDEAQYWRRLYEDTVIVKQISP